MILAGDIGGTKLHLAVYAMDGGSLRKEREALLRTGDVASPAETVRAFAAEGGERIQSCALGVAGPVVDGEVDGTNLPWVVRAGEISRSLDRVPVHLLNDLEASAHALDLLTPEDLSVVQEGRADPQANRALVSPGTGLGQCIVQRLGDRTAPVGYEGGHADFAPRTDEEVDLMRYLRDVWGRVSVERVVSGPGIVNVFCWLRDRAHVPDDSGIPAAPGNSEPAPAIAAAARDGRSGICRETMRVWVGAFGAEAGNVVLRGYAVGGLFLGGGIPAHNLSALRDGTFLEAFSHRAPHEEALRSMPVSVVLSLETTLLGAAAVASRA